MRFLALSDVLLNNNDWSCERRALCERTASWNVPGYMNNYNVQRLGDTAQPNTLTVYKRHMCAYCKKVYPLKNLLKKHMQSGCRMNPRGTPFACSFCPYKSMYKANMERHVRNVHETDSSHKFHCELSLVWSHKGDYGYDALHRLGDDGKAREKSYVCVNCGKGYAVKRSLWRHRKFECINPATKFTCDLCPYESPYKWRVDLHSRKHDPQSGYNQYYNAPVLWPYKRMYGYEGGSSQLHQQQDDGILEERERSYVCSICGKSYTVKRSLWRHQKFECVNAKPRIKCDLCSYRSPHRWCVDRHRKKHHGRIRPFPTAYRKMYMGDQVLGYTCTMCSKFYKMWSNYLKHKCEPPQFKCPLCPFAAFKAFILHAHQAEQHFKVTSP
ncbi:zinc finger protein 614-like [Odontomachus brunneus]|uniref:zinc finger protein 614-like n=1 Tax=Odontomachus brunneus TaxID=486640 RepID=UPI0013F19237|nr:zinc finger protein 614-like [Odontomachus brunneus]